MVCRKLLILTPALLFSAEALASDKAALNYSLMFSTARLAGEACPEVEFDMSGAAEAIKVMELTPEDVRKVAEYFAVTKPLARKRLEEDGVRAFCENAVRILAGQHSRIKMLRSKD
jgi:hypothetical protein